MSTEGEDGEELKWRQNGELISKSRLRGSRMSVLMLALVSAELLDLLQSSGGD